MRHLHCLEALCLQVRLRRGSGKLNGVSPYGVGNRLALGISHAVVQRRSRERYIRPEIGDQGLFIEITADDRPAGPGGSLIEQFILLAVPAAEQPVTQRRGEHLAHSRRASDSGRG